MYTTLLALIHTRSRPTRLLLVDPHPYALIGLRSLLRDCADVEVVADATTSADALRLYDTLRPDVVITDLGMPHMDRCELVAAIKAVCPQQPVIVLSLEDGPAERHAAQQAKADAFLTKDASRTQLLGHIRRLGRSQQGVGSVRRPVAQSVVR